MQASIVRIGNSRGVRLPKTVIDQCGFGEHVDLRVEAGRVILSRSRKAREGWREAIIAASREGAKDPLLLEGIPETEFDRDEWTW